MKKYLLLLMAVLALTSCSDDDKQAGPTTTPPVQNDVTTSSYRIMINEQEYKVDTSRTFKGIRQENMFSIEFVGCELTFDHKGRLGRMLYSTSGSYPKKFYSHFDNSAQHFSLNLIAVDSVNRRVSGSFSGYVNRDPLNFTGESKFIAGTFDVAYIDAAAPIKDLRHKAKLNGASWQMTNSYYSKGEANNNNNVLIHNMMDNEYKIMFGYNVLNYTVGTYNFTPASLHNTVRLAKYNNNTLSYVNYNTSGTVTITRKEPVGPVGGIIQLVSGVYTATAVNPENSADVIQITDGNFKFVTPNTYVEPY